LAIIVTAQDLASGKLSKVRTELASMGTSGKIASVGIGAGMLAVNKGEQALGNFKNRLTSLAAPLAMIGVTGGLFSIAGVLEQGISKANDLALATEKVTGATGLGGHAASQAVAVFGKYGIAADQTATMLGRLEKNAFTAANTQKLATKFQAEYGLSLLDSNGKVKDTTALLGTLSDYYVKNGNTAQTDAAMAKLLGKNWMELIPILKEGSKGYADQAAQADAAGTTLTDAQAKSAQAFIAQEKAAGQAVSGLETQLGLLVMPDLSAGLTAFTGYVASHKDDIEAFFKDGLHMAEQFGGFVTGTLVPDIEGVAGAVTSFWNKVPAPLKGLIVQGAVADRTLKFFFGMSPVHYVVSLAEGAIQKGLGNLVGGIFTKGSLANPMIVKDISLGKGTLPPGNGPLNTAENTAVNTAEGAGGAGAAETTLFAGGAATLATLAASVIGSAAVAAAIIGIENSLFHITPQDVQKANTHGQFGPRSMDNVPKATGSSSSGGTGGNVGQDVYPVSHVTDRLTDIVKNGNAQIAAFKSYRDGEREDLGTIAGLIGSTNGILSKEWGSASGKAGAITARSIAEHGGKTPAQSAVDATFQHDLITQEKKVAADGHTTASKITDLQHLESLAQAHGDTKTAATIATAIRAMTASLKAAADRTTAAIIAKQFSVAGTFLLNSPSLTHVAVRDVNTSANIRGSLGPDRRIGGSNSSPVRS
jgi:hypothetical protein